MTKPKILQALSHDVNQFQHHPLDYVDRGPEILETLRHAMVDYSTPPLRLHTGVDIPSFIVVDLSTTIYRYHSFEWMFDFYKKFPLHDIIMELLSTSLHRSEDTRHSDYILGCTEQLMGEDLDLLDLDEICSFYNGLTNELDMDICRSYPHYFEAMNYVAYRWVDPISLCMVRESFRPILEYKLPRMYPDTPMVRRSKIVLIDGVREDV